MLEIQSSMSRVYLIQDIHTISATAKQEEESIDLYPSAIRQENTVYVKSWTLSMFEVSLFKIRMLL